jgi:tRNA(Ile)-lysidine synthase
MNGFVRSLITEWRRLEMPVSDATVVIAVSGGADSVSLLLAMHELQQLGKLDLRFVAAHFNHKLRQSESDADEQFVRELTSGLHIEFAVGHAQPLPDNNLEQNARIARYAFLKRTAESVGAFGILTGHTMNDQAETFLMNLIRGSGPQGLCGMKSIRPIDDQPPRPADGCEVTDEEDPETVPKLFPTSTLLIRPLLTWAKRPDTEGYCASINVEYRYDTMNEDTAFRRVRIRKILLPLLEDFNPKIVETLVNTATLMQSLSPADNGIRSQQTDELRLADLKDVESNQVNKIIRSWLGQHRGTTRQLELKHIEAIQRLMRSTKSGREAEIPGGRVIKTGGKLVYKENKVEN